MRAGRALWDTEATCCWLLPLLRWRLGLLEVRAATAPGSAAYRTGLPRRGWGLRPRPIPPPWPAPVCYANCGGWKTSRRLGLRAGWEALTHVVTLRALSRRDHMRTVRRQPHGATLPDRRFTSRARRATLPPPRFLRGRRCLCRIIPPRGIPSLATSSSRHARDADTLTPIPFPHQ